MTENLPYFRLRPFVLLVKGASRSALYDLHSRRIFPIPQAAGYIIECCETNRIEDVIAGVQDPEDRLTAQSYLEELARKEFGRYHSDTTTLLPWNPTLPQHKLGQLRSLSIDLRGAAADPAGAPDWDDLLATARGSHACRQLTMFVSGCADRELAETLIAEAAHALQFHHVEVVFPATEVSAPWEALAARHGFRIALTARPDHRNATFLRLQVAAIKARFIDLGQPAPITERAFACDHETFQRLRNSSVHCNSLHIDSAGQVFPWAFETHHLIGKVQDGASLTRLMRSPELRQAWTHTKDAIEQCRDCEFRYACPHSYTFRQDPGRIASRPSNCDYDPYKAQWLQSKSDLFQECEGDGLDKKSTTYFDVAALKTKPFPEAYLELLDRMVESTVNCFGLPLPDRRFRYLYYPGPDELQKDVQLRYGGHVSGLTEMEHGNAAVIRTAYPGHVHEVLHAQLWNLNSTPNFFVSEACATMLGKCWGTESDLHETPQFTGEIRAFDNNGREISLNSCLICDDKGLFCGELRQHQSIHDVARVMLRGTDFKPNLAAWFDAVDESSLPGYFYELGGSFFLWLVEVYGAKTFQVFYRSRQTVKHLQEYYRTDIATLESQWLAFLKGAVSQ